MSPVSRSHESRQYEGLLGKGRVSSVFREVKTQFCGKLDSSGGQGERGGIP